MEDLIEKKLALRAEIRERLDALPKKAIQARRKSVEAQLFDFANFLEAELSLLYLSRPHEVDTWDILKWCRESSKEIVLPLFDPKGGGTVFYKVADLESDLMEGPDHTRIPDPDRCKSIDADDIDIAIIPGIGFDEKGGRLGSGSGRYDRLIPLLPATARKVALAFEDQLVPAIPMESHDKYVDIIITDTRVIYKI